MVIVTVCFLVLNSNSSDIVSCMFQEVQYNMNNELHHNYFRGKKQDFTSEILKVIKIDKPITKACNAIPSKASRTFSHHKKQSYKNANQCMFYHNYIKSRHKNQCRRNRKEVKFESRQNENTPK